MIYYSPTDGDVQARRIDYRPRTCFLMTKLGDGTPPIIETIRGQLQEILTTNNITTIDAETIVTGRDFLTKIWRLLLGVPLGIAVVYKGMTPQTLANIFYEIGLMHAYGKETLLIKTKGTRIPSDFVRTEYIQFGNDFAGRVGKFLAAFFALEEYYETMATQLERNPLLAIDYLRRAYLISANEECRAKTRVIVDAAGLNQRAKDSVEMMLADF